MNEASAISSWGLLEPFSQATLILSCAEADAEFYRNLPVVAITPADQKWGARLTERLGTPPAFVALFELARTVKIIQLFCRVSYASEFPFCCLCGTCRRPITSLCPQTQINTDQHPGMESPGSFLRRVSQGYLDIDSRRFNWYPDVFDFSNTLIDAILSKATWPQMMMTSWAMKAWLNRGDFFVCVLIVNKYLLQRTRILKPSDWVAEAKRHLKTLNTHEKMLTAMRNSAIDSYVNIVSVGCLRCLGFTWLYTAADWI